MKYRGFYRKHWVIILILALVALFPTLNLSVMIWNAYAFSSPSKQFCNISYFLSYFISLGWSQNGASNAAIIVIPFAAITLSILFGFIIFPFLKGLTSRIRHIIISVIAIGLFINIELWAERLAIRLYMVFRLIDFRMVMSPEQKLRIALDKATGIPPGVRIHYYMFSIILILAVLNWLYNLIENRHKQDYLIRKSIIRQGIATACFISVVLFVKRLQYIDRDALYLTWGSVLNIGVLFVLAALSVGLYSSSLFRFKGHMKVVPSLLSILTVLALYGAEYVMLGGRFYTYGNDIYQSFIIHFIIIFIPGITVNII